jgi:hypothetical protein
MTVLLHCDIIQGGYWPPYRSQHREETPPNSGTDTVPCVGNAEQRRRSELMFCVSVKRWRHSDIFICVPSFWALRTPEI